MSQTQSGSSQVQVDEAAGMPLRSNEGLCFRMGARGGAEAVASVDGTNGHPGATLPDPINTLGRYIATCHKNRHQFFWFSAKREIDPALVYIASDDAFHLGVLSSLVHIIWVRTAGGMDEDPPRYNGARCFAPFPFPEPSSNTRKQIAELANQLDQHRKNAMAADDRVAMTAIYDVITKLRSTEVFTSEERIVHRVAEGKVLREMHHDLDRLVARAYGWRWPMNRQDILRRLVELHDVRVEEEKGGDVRWLRPEYQMPRFGATNGLATSDMDLRDAHTGEGDTHVTS